MKTLTYFINEEKNEIDDNFLDIIGNAFKFDHEKGIAEWLKNSVDAYIRSSISDSKQFVILRFTDGKNNDARMECIDFNGMSSLDIDKALKRWGDPEAAKRGLSKKVYGGHGNGGKFYMRQMFSKSHFITYKNGLINIFGFNESKKYGFADGYKNKPINYDDALKLAGLDEVNIPKDYLAQIKINKSGFTVVRGISPVGMKNIIKVNKICEKIKKHPQSMRLLDRIKVEVIHNSEQVYAQLKPEVITPLKDFSEPFVSFIPAKLYFDDGDEKQTIEFENKKYPSGRLVLKTSEIALTSNSKYSELNRIDIIGEIGVIASYPLRELGLYYPQTDFIYGECECPILEDPNEDCVMNDRTKLAENGKTKALLEWVKEQVKELSEKISSKADQEREEINKKLSSDYNNFLNSWKNKFMARILSDIFVGPGEGSGFGFGEKNSSPIHDDGKSSNKNTPEKSGDKGSGNDPKKGSRFPQVLLSGHDDDPLNPGHKLTLQPGHGLVYQRAQDVKEGIYWINTSGPLAEAILNKYDANSARWRDYLFQRYIDIFVKEALLKLEKNDQERFNAFTIDGEILGKMVLKIHEAAAKDLDAFLFSERYEARS